MLKEKLKKILYQYPKFKLVENPKYRERKETKIYAHVTKKKNIKSIFQYGMIPKKVKGWLESDVVWMWTDSIEQILPKFNSKPSCIILLALKSSEINKAKDASVAIYKGKEISKSKIMGAIKVK